MKSQSTITLKQIQPPIVQQTYSSALSPFHDIVSDESKGKHLVAGDCSTTQPFLHLLTGTPSPPSSPQAFPFQALKSSSNPKPDFPTSYSPHLQFHKTMNSQSSTFCTSLYSSSASSDTHWKLHNLPFLAHPPKSEQTIPSMHSSKSPVLLSGDSSNQFAEESSGNVTDFLNLSEDASDGSFHGATYRSSRLSLSEQLELQFLSEELDIAITDNGANPRMDDIYEAHQGSSVPNVVSNCNQNHLHPPPLPVDDQIHSCNPSSGTAGSHKPRMRWTPELHEHFLEAVKKLDGAEKATPKGILKLMNIEGLTIYHVKSHLQKYRLAKYMPETVEEDNKNSCSDEKEKQPASNISEGGHTKNGVKVTEALRMQMEVQKQLHEQLEVQRALQLRIEEHARYLQKIVEEQEKTCNSFGSASSTQLLTETRTGSELCSLPTPSHSLSEQAESKNDSSSSLPSKHKAMECNEVEQLVGQKRSKHEAKPEPETSKD